MNTTDQTVKYIPQIITATDETSTARDQEVPNVTQHSLTINPLFQQCSSLSPSNEFSEHSPNMNMLIREASHFSVKGIAFIDEDVSEKAFCVLR